MEEQELHKILADIFEGDLKHRADKVYIVLAPGTKLQIIDDAIGLTCHVLDERTGRRMGPYFYDEVLEVAYWDIGEILRGGDNV